MYLKETANRQDAHEVAARGIEDRDDSLADDFSGEKR